MAITMIAMCPQCGAKNRVDETRAVLTQPKCGRCGTRLSTPESSGSSDHPITVTDATFDRDVLGRRDGRPILVDFWAAWCGPCRLVAPEIDKLAEKYAGSVEVVKLDVDANPHTAMHYGIMSIPTVALFAPGQPPRAAVGFRPAEALEEAFELASFTNGSAASTDGAATQS